MAKYITSLTIITIISAILIPITTQIYGITNIPNEVLGLPNSFHSLGQFANLIITSLFTGLLFGYISYLLYFEPLKKLYLVMMYLLMVFLTLVETFCLAKFGLAISPPMTAIMADTNNMTEITGFFETYFDFPTLVFIVLLCTIAWLIWHYSEKILNFIIKFKKFFISIGILFVVIALAGAHKIAGMTASPPIMKAIYCAKYWYKVKSSIAKMSKDVNRVEILSNKSDTAFIIFIIGESESRHFMGMYNSKYESTPLCNKLIDSGNMFAFTNTISMKSSTAQVMTPLLSFMENTTETTDLTKFDPIVDVFTKAGYQAFWISNHEKITKDLSYATYMSSRCNYSTFTSKSSGNVEHISRLCLKDEVILPHLDEYIKNQVPHKNKNLFCFQIMGSHIRYKDRVPDNFNKFKYTDVKEDKLNENQKKTVAEYLNTIYYTDYIINEIVSRFSDKDAIMFYVSDHGEEMWQSGFVGHGPTNVSKYMVDIPFLIWVSDKYKEKRLENVERIKASLNKPFMTDNLVHVMLDLSGIETKQYDPTKSIINQSFKPRDRIVINGMKYEDLRK